MRAQYWQTMMDESQPPAAGGPDGESANSDASGSSDPSGAAVPENSAAASETNAKWLDTPADNWREAIAGDDEAMLNTLKRHKDLRSVLKSGWEAQQKIRRGEVSKGLPENPTDEQLAEWRQANGVPEAPDKYVLDIEEGLVLGAEDTRILQEVQSAAHAANVSSAALSKITNAFLQGRQQEQEALQAQDGLHQQQAERQLKEAWGQDFQANVNLAKMFVSQLPEEVRDKVASARLSDGRALFNSPEVLDYIAEHMRKIAPAATLIPNSSNPMQSINDEIKRLEDRMGTSEWYRDNAAQKRYRDLIEAREHMK